MVESQESRVEGQGSSAQRTAHLSLRLQLCSPSRRAAEPNCDPSHTARGLHLVTELSDAEIIRRVLAGESSAFRFLVARYRVRFGRFAIHMLGNRDDAEEVLQDAFFRAYRALARCRDPERFDAWLFRIVANRCRTVGARRGRRDLALVRDQAALEAVPCELPDEPGDRAEAASLAVARLDPATREAFLLKYVEELSFSKMARLTGVGVSALKMRVRRAAERLRSELEEAGYD